MEKVNLSSFSTWALFAVLPVLLVLYYRKLTKPYSQFPTSHAFFYTMKAYLMGGTPRNRSSSSFLLQTLNGIAKIFEKEGLFILWCLEPTLFVFSPDAVKFFITEPAAIEKSKKYDALKCIFGNGLLTSNSKVWAQHRKIINPTFHRKLYKTYMPVYNGRAHMLVQDLKKETEKPWIDIEHFVQICTFNILLETIVGVKEDYVVRGTSVNEYFQAVSKMTNFTVQRFSRPWLHYDFMLPFFRNGKKYMHSYEVMRSFSKQVIKQILESSDVANKELPEEEVSDFVKGKCKPFVRSFLEVHRKNPEAFSLEDIEFELTTFIAAGYDTTTVTATSVIYLLGLHPEIQERAFDEIESKVVGELTYEDVENLTYLESIIKENLRLFPTVPMFARRLSKEVQYGKYTVPKDTEIVFMTCALQKNPEIFPNPEKFDPDRFASNKIDQHSRFTYIPFAEGPRYCIGRKFAMVQLKVLMAHILRSFKIISLDPRDKRNLKFNIVQSSVKTTRIQLVPR